MKVAILSSLYSPYDVGGTEKAVRMLAESLSARGTEVVVISLHPGRQELLEEWNGIRVYRLPIDNLYLPWVGGQRPGGVQRLIWHLRDRWNWKAARRVGSILERERPDVMHSHNVSGFSVAVWAMAKRMGIARLHTLQDYYALCSKTTLYRNERVCERRCPDCVALTSNRKRATAGVDAVAGITQCILQRHVDAGYFQGAAQEVVTHIQPAAPRPRPKQEDGTMTFGFIGRVTNDKGVELLLEAMAALPGEACELKIAGRADPEYLAVLKQRFPDARIQWLGYTEAEPFYSLVDVVIIPSVWAEPLAYTCIEAMFAGKSVIASDIGGLREIAALVPQYQLFKAGDAAALAAAMQEALQNKVSWKQSRIPSPEVCERFSGDTVVHRYQELYRSIAAKPKGSTAAEAAEL
jgi:glycosyltransferase involved in cell wall biosynthesis